MSWIIIINYNIISIADVVIYFIIIIHTVIPIGYKGRNNR